jgi:hypothetical protein
MQALAQYRTSSPYKSEKSPRMLHVRRVMFSESCDEHMLFGIDAIAIRCDDGERYECCDNPVDRL